MRNFRGKANPSGKLLKNRALENYQDNSPDCGWVRIVRIVRQSVTPHTYSMATSRAQTDQQSWVSHPNCFCRQRFNGGIYYYYLFGPVPNNSQKIELWKLFPFLDSTNSAGLVSFLKTFCWCFCKKNEYWTCEVKLKQSWKISRLGVVLPGANT